MRSQSPRHRAAAGLALLLLASGFAAPAAAEVYQWRDNADRLHFGDQPPATADYQRFEPSGAIADAPRRAPSPGRDEAAEAAAGEAATSCEEARETLEGYRSADRVEETAADGEQRTLSETEREERIAMQQGLVDRVCD